MSEIKQKIPETCTALLGLSAVATTAGADPAFPVKGGADLAGGANIQFCQIFQIKTA